MFDLPFKLLKNNNQKPDLKTKNQIAKLLQISPEAFDAFEASYQTYTQNHPNETREHPAFINADDAIRINAEKDRQPSGNLKTLEKRIVGELIRQTPVIHYNGTLSVTQPQKSNEIPVKQKELMQFPEKDRPQLTGSMYCIDCDPHSSLMLLKTYMEWKKTTFQAHKATLYGQFRTGLDLLDLDPVLYEMLSLNPNSIGNWFPQLAKAVATQGFFKIPETTIIKVPLPLLQMSRLEYTSLTRSTLNIANEYCKEIFKPDPDKDVFIKTGVFSSKYDFRNAHVTKGKEVSELGEYLLFIQHQTCMMAGPLMGSTYGANTTNEWVVREFIHDPDHNPCIYNGLPLRTEYRIFADMDAKTILGISPYWEPATMKKRFGQSADSDHPDNFHDYIAYAAHEPVLMKRYNDNKERVLNQMITIIRNIEDLSGQWSIDVMQNGNEFWIIDMALAQTSALKECVPAGLLKDRTENWIPILPEKTVNQYCTEI